MSGMIAMSAMTVTFANNVVLGGHVSVGDNTFFSAVKSRCINLSASARA